MDVKTLINAFEKGVGPTSNNQAKALHDKTTARSHGDAQSAHDPPTPPPLRRFPLVASPQPAPAATIPPASDSSSRPAAPTMTPPSEADSDGAAYWRAYCRSLVAGPMARSGSYTPRALADHTAFLDGPVAAALGPCPSDAATAYMLCRKGLGDSPLEVSLCFRAPPPPPAVPAASDANIPPPPEDVDAPADDPPVVRLTFEVLGQLGGSPSDPFAQHAATVHLAALAAATPGADLSWAHVVRAGLFLDEEEQGRMVEKLGPRNRVPHCYAAFDLDGSGERQMKVYFPPMLKAMATGRDAFDVALGVVRGLGGFDDVLDLLKDYVSTLDPLPACTLVALDCTSPHTTVPRVKLYFELRTAAFSAVRAFLTLGGRMPPSRSTDTTLALLRGAWHLLLDEPDGLPSEDWNKGSLDAANELQGTVFSVEMVAGRPVPQIKVYMPVYQFARSGRMAMRNYQAFLTAMGVRWDYEGVMEELLGAATIDAPIVPQTLVSFMYTEEQGVYTSSYWTRPIYNNRWTSDAIQVEF